MWLNTPDQAEAGGIPFTIEDVLIESLDGISWTVNTIRREYQTAMNRGDKFPLILVERKKDGSLELHDGQHRLAAYRNIFANQQKITCAVFEKKTI